MVNQKRIESLLRLGIGLLLLVILNQLAGIYPMRLDLTEEKRYSVTPATRAMLEDLQDVVYIEVFLEGEMPAGFKRLRKAIEETLSQFDYYADGLVKVDFIDPSAALNEKARNEYFRSLMQRGLQPTNLSYKRDGNKTEKLIFPGAIVSYYGQEVPVTLLRGSQSATAEERLNQSIEGLEYELANAIRILSNDRKKTVALIQGHGEPDSLNLAGLTNALLEKYDVFNVDLSTGNKDLGIYDAVIFPKPATVFSTEEKYEIDQYIMNGGKTLFFVDALRVNMDSASGEGTFAFPYELGLDDMFFKYGVRINRDYVQDIVCGEYPIVAGNMGDQAQIRMLPWPFFPMVNNFGNHPIVKNLDAVSMKFVSTIDTVKADGIEKIPLLKTSQYSMVNQAPVKVAFNELRKNLDPERFNQGSKNVAYLLKGKFTSIYKNRILPKGINKSEFKGTGKETSILICSDGDMIRNEFSLKDGTPMELGLSPYSQMKFANKDFVMNAVDYMLNDQGLIVSKNKSLAIRPLDKVKIAKEKLIWQLINLVLPIVLLVIYGVLRAYWRKRKYASFK
ncbi:gliding motility-associated ABC transporter substrate-binding protein GldG [Reichenbachiella carrageenanivorans]|uniref:Gliding motility-associated ABC transporter substrate-binding protein GldG n=1 Tax=Reichenbachiella carrageenanivorans TaxID=2979869 RepID=A0ABY6CWR2_9BACT|nr:gliding motility-associated ABC transporter substrate-binding protein GldG [Reichenbachiella carrageenanivorans]UXX78308.1 gliding motility-associated ABC transporter substrate-binding protein GldG [Reichenbachiella carrageenanivorans]